MPIPAGRLATVGRANPDPAPGPPGETVQVNLDLVVAPGDTAPVDQVAPGDMALLYRVGPGDMAPVDRVEPADMAPVDRAGPADMAPVDRMGPADMAPVDRMDMAELGTGRTDRGLDVDRYVVISPAVADLGWLLSEATHWRDGVPSMVSTLAKAGVARTGVSKLKLTY